MLVQLTAQKAGEKVPVPKDLLVESKIAEKMVSDLGSVNALGHQVPF